MKTGISYIRTLGVTLFSALTLVTAQAQDKFPHKLVRLVVGFPAGSATDVATRIVANQMSQEFGQPFLVENKPGASSEIAAKSVASSAPDGYTLFVLTIANIINASAGKAEGVSLEKNFTSIASIGSVPIVLVANPQLKIQSVKELIAAAQTKPKEISYASSGNGTAPHLSGELFAKMAHVDMLHVPYKGSSQALADLLSGQVNIMFAPASTVLPHTKTGKLIGLGVASPKRIILAPELPTLDELGLRDFESSVWFGVVAPMGTPSHVVEMLSAGFSKALSNPNIREELARQGVVATEGNPRSFERFWQSELKKWSGIIKEADIKL
jgi:tripartite-type tricarboxylate transporter receptor subunit TctC